MSDINNNIAHLEKDIISFEWETISTSKEKYNILKQMVKKYFPQFDNDSEDMKKIINTICNNYYNFIFESIPLIAQQKNIQQNTLPNYLKELSALGFSKENIKTLIFRDAKTLLNKYIISNQLQTKAKLEIDNFENFISNNFNDTEYLDDIDEYLINKNINPLSIVDFIYEFPKEEQSLVDVKIQLNIVLRLGYYFLCRYKQFLSHHKINIDSNIEIYTVADFFIEEFNLLPLYEKILNDLETTKGISLYNITYKILSDIGINLYVMYFGNTKSIQNKIAEELKRLLAEDLEIDTSTKTLTDEYGNPLNFNIKEQSSANIEKRFGGMIGSPNFDLNRFRKDPIEIKSTEYYEELGKYYTSDEKISYNDNNLSHKNALNIFKEYDYKYPNIKLEEKLSSIPLSIENIQIVMNTIIHYTWSTLDTKLIEEFDQYPLQYVASYEAFGKERNFMNYNLEITIKDFIRLCYWVYSHFKKYPRGTDAIDFYIQELQLNNHPNFRSGIEIKLNKWLTSQIKLPYFVLPFYNPLELYNEIQHKILSSI
jgi:hypothetical protein